MVLVNIFLKLLLIVYTGLSITRAAVSRERSWSGSEIYPLNGTSIDQFSVKNLIVY